MSTGLRYRIALNKSRNWLILSGVALAILFSTILFQFFSAWQTFDTFLMGNGATPDFYTQRLYSYSAETYDTVIALRRLESACAKHALGLLSTEQLRLERAQLIGKISHFTEKTLIRDSLAKFESFEPAMLSADAFIEGVKQLEAGRIDIPQLIELANLVIADWMLLNTDTLANEYAMRDSMERAIDAFRPLAERAILIISVLAVLCGAALFAALYAGWRLVATERERFDRFEYLVASVGHDLRSPLQAIESASSLLTKQSSPEARTHYASIVRVATKTLARLVDDILQIVRKEQFSIELQSVEVKTWFENFIKIYREKAQAKGLVLKDELRTDLPCLVFDPERMTQCIGNLVGNAIRYTPQGVISVTFSVVQGDASDDASLIVAVEDTGPGIPKEQFKRIFQPFERASVIEDSKGMGLGLSIASSLAKSFGGRIEVQSQVGVGSIFTLKMPAKAPTCPEKLSSSIRDLPMTIGVAMDTIDLAEILVVDDDAAICQSVAGLLREAGFTVDTAANGVAALENVQREQYKLVLTDIQMPMMDGFTLAQNCKKLANPPHVVAMTAYTENLRADPRAAVFDGVLTKVFSDEALLAMIDRTI